MKRLVPIVVLAALIAVVCFAQNVLWRPQYTMMKDQDNRCIFGWGFVDPGIEPACQPGALLWRGDEQSFYYWDKVLGWIKWLPNPVKEADAFYEEFSEKDFWANAGGPINGAPGGAGSTDPPYINLLDGETNHPGIIRLVTDDVSGDVTGTWRAKNVGFVRWDQIDYAEFVFRTGDVLTSSQMEVGLTSNPEGGWPSATFEAGTNMIYMFRDTNTSTACVVKFRVGGSTTNTIPIVDPCPASTWVDFLIDRRVVGTTVLVDITVNGTKRASITTGLPADTATFGGAFRIGTRTTATRRLDVDYASIKPTTLTQRWTDGFGG